MNVREFFRLKRGCAKCIRWWERIAVGAAGMWVLAEAALWWHGRPTKLKLSPADRNRIHFAPEDSDA